MDFEERAKAKIEQALLNIIHDADYEVKRHPEKKDEITKFCNDLMEQTSKFFETYKKGVPQIYPMMPTKYSRVKRAELREFERKLLTGSEDKNIKPDINIEK